MTPNAQGVAEWDGEEGEEEGEEIQGDEEEEGEEVVGNKEADGEDGEVDE